MTAPAFMHPAAAAALSALSPLLGPRLSAGQSVRALHGAGESWLPAAPPDLVAMAETTEEVSQILSICNRLGLPVVPFGAGSSIEGQIRAAMADRTARIIGGTPIRAHLRIGGRTLP